MSTSKRNLYHTHLKYLAHENLLSTDIVSQIPKSTLARWMKEDPGRYETFSLSLKASSDYETIHHFAHNNSFKKVYASYVRISKFVLSVVHQLPGFHRELKMRSKKVVELVEHVKDFVGLKRILGVFNISVQTFRNWSAQSLAPCFESLTNSCNRVFHNQLSRPEALKIKDLLTDTQFQYWPVSSVALYALRKNILPISINTWYKYVNKLGLVRLKQRSRRKKNAVSVRASGPNQIWHADITVFVTADQVKQYIYAVVDNFSRKILSWLIADSVKADYRKVTIEEALKNVKHTHPGITLITDGGPENSLQSFLATIGHQVEHKIALVDVHYSNSLIEAHFKVLKYNYLYQIEVRDGAHLRKIFSYSVKDFNERPHISLQGLTPNEAEQCGSLNKEQLHLYIKKATEERRRYNQIHRCVHCKV